MGKEISLLGKILGAPPARFADQIRIIVHGDHLDVHYIRNGYVFAEFHHANLPTGKIKIKS